MGKELVERFDRAREAFAEADEALGESVSALCFETCGRWVVLVAAALEAGTLGEVAALAVFDGGCGKGAEGCGRAGGRAAVTG